MTHEITLKLDAPAALVRRLREMIPVNADEIDLATRPAIESLCAQIEEQVKPAIEEPTDFGSIVRARSYGPLPMLWQRSPLNGRSYWESDTGAVEVWSALSDVEVLRVGLGEPLLKPFFKGVAEGFCSCHGSERGLECGISAHRKEARVYHDPMDDAPESERADVAPEYTEDYKAGVSDTVHKVHGRLQLLYADAITAERKNALEKAIQAVEELAP